MLDFGIGSDDLFRTEKVKWTGRFKGFESNEQSRNVQLPVRLLQNALRESEGVSRGIWLEVLKNKSDWTLMAYSKFDKTRATKIQSGVAQNDENLERQDEHDPLFIARWIIARLRTIEKPAIVMAGIRKFSKTSEVR